ncbi:hypothetical protein ACP70R_002789 [Stipagrostis hirtigluma subsp. patula]
MEIEAQETGLIAPPRSSSWTQGPARGGAATHARATPTMDARGPAPVADGDVFLSAASSWATARSAARSGRVTVSMARHLHVRAWRPGTPAIAPIELQAETLAAGDSPTYATNVVGPGERVQFVDKASKVEAAGLPAGVRAIDELRRAGALHLSSSSAVAIAIESLQPAAEWEAAHAMEAELMRVRGGGGHDRTRCRSARRKEWSSKLDAMARTDRTVTQLRNGARSWSLAVHKPSD